MVRHDSARSVPATRSPELILVPPLSDLAVQCRLAFYDRPRHKLLFRYGLLYPLYAITELGIIFTDLAELLGSAIAINLFVRMIHLPFVKAEQLTDLCLG